MLQKFNGMAVILREIAKYIEEHREELERYM